MRAVQNIKKIYQNLSALEVCGNSIASIKRLLNILPSAVFAGSLVLLSQMASADSETSKQVKTAKPAKVRQTLKLEVIDPYIEISTGPGRGYPIFHVIEQGEYIEVLTRRPDWYEIRAKNGSVGWTPASQVSRTLQPSGEPVDLPSVSYGDYLKNSWRFGFSAGSFSSGELKGMDSFNFNVGYRPWSWLGFDLEVGNMYGLDIKGNFGNANILIEPFSRWRFSPVFIWGTGSMKISSQPKLAPLDFDRSDFDIYGIGIHSYLGRNFVVRSEFRTYTIATNENDERIEAWQIGFNTFF